MPRQHLVILTCGLAALFLSEAGVVCAKTIRVRAGAAGPGDGQTWETAVPDLQTALGMASAHDEIWVAEGMYTPGPPGDATSSFVMMDDVALLGGFSGIEITQHERNPETHVTILSGDVGHDDVFSGGGISGWNFNTSNCGHVVIGSDVGPGAVLDGFTITSGATGPVGTVAGDPLMYGSGLYIINGSPTVRRCVFTRNLAAFAAGAGIYCMDASPIISNCDFIENAVHLGNGAGIAAYGSALPAISDCRFRDNLAIADYGNSGQGAGVCFNFLTAPLSATIERCVFEYNVARTFYSIGGIEIARGGGISNFGATLTVRDCIFRYNSANAGAGLQTWDPATIVNCLFYRNDVYSHDFSSAGGDGGYGAGICIYSFQPDTATIINTTIVDNTGGEGVGVQSLANANLVIRNSIIWGNLADGQDVSPLNAQVRGSSSIRHSCVQDLLTPIPDEDPPDPANYPGCIVIDPQFAAPGAGDYRLSASSPCIDAGRNSDVPVDVLSDLAGASRFVDDPDVADTGVGTAPLVDMGAFEQQLETAIGDVNCDGVVNVDDVPAFVQVLMGLDMSACHVEASDLNGDSIVDGRDVQGFLASLAGS